MFKETIKENLISESERNESNSLRTDVSLDTKKQDGIKKSELPEEIIIKDFSKFQDFIPEDERDIETELPTKYSKAKDMGYFSPATGMAQLGNIFGDCIYAAIYENETGKRIVKFCQKYLDGAFSPQMSVSQADLLLLAVNNFKPQNIDMPPIKAKVNKFIGEIWDEYYGKVMGQEHLNILSILQALYKSLESLPIYLNAKAMPPEQFYMMVVEAIQNNFNKEIHFYIYHKSYYALSEDELSLVLKELGLTKNELLAKLVEYKFLYTTPSSNKYKTKVRICEDETQWSYCIVRLEYMNHVGEKDYNHLDDIEEKKIANLDLL